MIKKRHKLAKIVRIKIVNAAVECNNKHFAVAAHAYSMSWGSVFQ
jgi:hypothetical protein